ncbi:hypothetical protein, partial [Pseudomonas poae]|uniref:hypothetical protein n=1 Tax=Pseudomonas poae TaxID=200451 RepID=UPI001F236CC7
FFFFKKKAGIRFLWGCRGGWELLKGKSPFGYFWGSFPKVTRRKGGTNSRRYPNNGYVPVG